MAAPWRVYPVQWLIKFRQDQADRIRNRAVLDGTTPSQVIRDAVDDYLSNNPAPDAERVA